MAPASKVLTNEMSGLHFKAIATSSTIFLSVCLVLLYSFGGGIYCGDPDPEYCEASMPDQFPFSQMKGCSAKTLSAFGDRVLRLNPRFTGDKAAELIIRGASLFDGDSWHGEPVDILIREGVIQDIGRNIRTTGASVTEVFAHGRPVTPGLVDMHSHSGVDSLPYSKGFYDLYELSADLTPYVRTIDAIYTSDASIPIIASGGVTTSLVLPGSTNIIGGEAYAIKNRVPPSLSVNEMLVEGNATNAQRYMKFACGGNPKTFHARFPERPKSRMGMAWALRQHFDRVRALKTKQDRWLAAAKTKKVQEEFPFSLELESSVAVLRGKVRTNFHCYAPHDMESILRVAEEFNFKVHAFHHAHDAHLILDILKQSTSNTTVAIFSGTGLYSMESYRPSVFAAMLLEQNDIPVAVHSDHPELNAKHLVYEAAINHHFGQSEIGALKSLTAVPATALGLEHRIGYAKEGYDADLVLWDEHPLRLGATPLQVWIDGSSLPEGGRSQSASIPTHEALQAPRQWKSNPSAILKKNCKIGARDLVIKGISKSFLEDFPIQKGNNTLVLKEGRIVCLGECSVEEGRMAKKGVNIMTLHDGYIVPGITTLGLALGLSDIDDEPSAQDGTLRTDAADLTNLLYTKHGLSFSGKHLDFARRSGVLQAVTSPNCAGFFGAPGSLFRGVSAAFRTGARSVLENEAILKDDVGLHIRIGQDGKGSNTPTISSQIAALRNFLASSNGKKDIFGRILSGYLPLVVECGNKDIIGHLIKVKRDYPKIRIVIAGGQEAWMLAEDLAKAKIGVILSPWRCLPMTFETRNCLPGPPMSESSIAILHKAGVNTAIGLPGDSLARNLWFEAGWAKKWGNLTEIEAVALVTTNMENILGLQDVLTAKRQQSNFVIFEGSPMHFGSAVAVIVEETGAGKGVTDCWPTPE